MQMKMHWWDDIERAARRTLGEICPIATLSTTNLTRTGLGSKPSLYCQRPAT